MALANLSCGDVSDNGVTVCTDIPMGHKFALRDIKKGEAVIKYGYPIGSAACDIRTGEHVHCHNVKSDIHGTLDYVYEPSFCDLAKRTPETFQGYVREDGSVGIRNEIWIVPTVGCVNSIVKAIEQGAKQFASEGIDGIYAFNHPYGCSQLGGDMQNTLRFLSGIIQNPNAAAVLVIGLGCENGNLQELKKVLGEVNEKRVRFLNAQDEEDEIACGIAAVRELCDYAKQFRRSACRTDCLKIGLKCGGSDGFSGITANALVGAFTDRLVAEGGSAVLTEVPEMFGAETILMNRCRNQSVFEKTVSLINDFKKYFMKYGEKTDENPSPGNKEGGISTNADKSLGCIQKGGSAVVEDVLGYAESIRVRGLSLMQAPGNDLVAANALAASGCQMVLFTTGRGTPFGCPVPTVKIASNGDIFARKQSWMDFNAGELLESPDKTVVEDAFFEAVLRVCSGEKTKSEQLDKTEFAIFKDGVTL